MRLKIREIAVFGMLGALMFASKLAMEILPNMHLLGAFIVSITVVYRRKALYPIYVFVLVTGLFYGFATWWIPYLYIWTVLWGAVMLLPRNMPVSIATIVYMIVSSLHGFLFGVLYAPAQALLYGFDLSKTLAWIAYGFPYDVIHGVSNLICGILIVPLVKAIKRASRM